MTRVVCHELKFLIAIGPMAGKQSHTEFFGAASFSIFFGCHFSKVSNQATGGYSEA